MCQIGGKLYARLVAAFQFILEERSPTGLYFDIWYCLYKILPVCIKYHIPEIQLYILLLFANSNFNTTFSHFTTCAKNVYQWKILRLFSGYQPKYAMSWHISFCALCIRGFNLTNSSSPIPKPFKFTKMAVFHTEIISHAAFDGASQVFVVIKN
jgi:hypothetical protein